MGKTKTALLSIQRSYKGNVKSSTIQVAPLGNYRSFSEKLMDSVRDTVLFLFKDEPEVANSFTSDDWIKLYTGVMNYFDSDSSYGSYSISNNDIGELSNVTVTISILNPNTCGRDSLLFWMNVPKLDQEYEEQQNKYKLPEVKPDNTHYTN